MIRTLAAALALATLFVLPAAAQSAADPSGFGALSRTADDQVAITADALEVLDEENAALFTGNVVIRQAEMEMRAPSVRALYGDGGPSDLVNFTASGGRVEMAFDGQTAVADQAFYDFSARVLTLTGDVVVTNSGGTVSSPRLVIDTRAGTSSFSGGDAPGGRVTGIFTPGG